ncbi:toprim domain-containing protein [Larkinella sp. C7]|uniref:toprim domain-containing protein n=1 Tax=Larkinella sp. C7 TaxID=2576607 RepID=UPI0011111D3A|nr:toprim domain-containing protein [Larkinella sp. C7]
MNSDHAKKLSLPDLLARLGHTPVRSVKDGRELWYRSPFREEQEPSFHTSFIGGKWIWNDFGDIGGTVLDFVMRNQGFTKISDALSYLDRTVGSRPSRPQIPPGPDLFSFQQQSSRAAAENFSESGQLEFIEAYPIRNPVILSYLSSERCIPPSLAKLYLQEVRYRNTAMNKEYFGFGMLNQTGGYEIRAASSKYTFKTPLIARDITIIPGISANRSAVYIFEGMTDFLSFLVLTGAKQVSDDAIIMHSLTSYDRAAAYLRAQNYEQLWTYLDNDKAGQQGTERFKADFGAKVFPQSDKFATHKDLNEALRAQQVQRKSR